MSDIWSPGGSPVEPPRSPSRSSWMSLPPELRTMILEKVAHQKLPGWGSLASVCREWQDVIEKENYKKLKLGAPCLDELNDMVPQRMRHCVKHIWLEIELPRDPYACCLSWNPPQSKSSPIVSQAIQKLFLALSAWEQRRRGKLTLELNVVSPSDSQHWFKPLYFSDERAGEDDGPAGRIHDPRHGWVNGRKVSRVPEVALRRAFRAIKLDSSFERRPLPWVFCVSRFIIRRQLRRCISPAGLSAILEALPLLGHMSYEPWALYDVASLDRRQNHVTGLRRAILQELSNAVSSLVVFEDSRKFYKVLQPEGSGESVRNTIHSIAITDILGDAFAKKSRGLEHLAVSFMADAKDIFRHCKPSWTWPRLKSVALTSQLLRDDPSAHGKIKDLLCRAAALAKQMPELDTFVLWNGGKGNACAFIYRVSRGQASITWRGTWPLEMSRDAVEAWEAAARTQPYRVLEIHQERVEGAINCVGDAIHHLKLPCQVAEPASLWQMRREGNLVP